ncbi:MAG: DUF1264 domain-containing protein, partial [Nitrospirota bacterium]|nr:DUF1264 domain-containing protein [Nitrospirota bacterium]
MQNSIRTLTVICGLSFFAIGYMATPAISGEGGPADGYTIHVQAPHMMANGTPGGPFHHYCKGISPEVLQCLLFKSTDPNAKLVAVEYFLAKDLVRKNVPLITW